MILDRNALHDTSLEILNYGISRVNKEFKTAFNIQEEMSVVSYTGGIEFNFEQPFMDFIELVKSSNQNAKLILILLSTSGGSVESVERMVNILRANYEKVYFLIPDIAMSAGTILCMSGDRIYMDYFSALGPIDPQVRNENNNYVPALGYIDKLEELVEKSRNNTLTDAEFMLLQKQDLGMIRAYEQARDLTVNLLQKWLVEYKFKEWVTHKDGRPVTLDEKKARAQEIAKQLGDNKEWHSHGRYIDIKTLTDKLKLKIEDYSNKNELRDEIKQYMRILKEHINRLERRIYFHSNL